MKKIITLILSCSIFTSVLPQVSHPVFAIDNTLYGDADGNKAVELMDVNLMERYISQEEEAVSSIHFKEADVNADGIIDDTDVTMVKDYLVNNRDTLTPELHTISFNSDGGGDFASIEAGEGYPYRGELPVPQKEEGIFKEWVKEDGTVYQKDTEVITTDLNLTAVYEDTPTQEELTITSFALEDQPTDVSFTVSGNVSTPDDVKAMYSLVTKDGTEPVETAAKDNGNGTFTIYAVSGFNPGSTYALTLSDGLNFHDKDAMFRTVNFIIHKDEVDNIVYNPDMIFIQDTAEMQYTIGSETLDVIENGLLSNEESETKVTGTFNMTTQNLETGDIVSIYETTDPRDRDYTTNDYEDDAMAFIRITAVSGDTYSFESLDENDTEEVLAMPDSIPFKVDTLPEGTEGSIDINSYDTNAWTMLGESTAPQVDINDFLIFYTVEMEEADENTPVVYGQVTRIENETAWYKVISKEDIENYMNFYVSQPVSSDEILESINQEETLAEIEKQAEESGFMEEAMTQIAASALETPEVQARLQANNISPSEIQAAVLSSEKPAIFGKGKNKFLVEDPYIHAEFFKDRHFEDNGVGLRLEVGITLSFTSKMTTTAASSIKLSLNAAFEQEVMLDVDADVSTRWKWYFIIPVLQEVEVRSSVDIGDFTAMSIGARTYTVASDPSSTKKWKALANDYNGPHATPRVKEALRKIDTLATKAKRYAKKGQAVTDILTQIESYKNMLPKVEIDGKEYSFDELEKELLGEDVSDALDEVLGAEDEVEARTGTEALMERYKQMLQMECDWIQLFNKEMFKATKYLGVVAVDIKVNFLIEASMNISLGADFEYQIGKRYSFWLHILEGTSGSSEVDLVDERFHFQFYVMGTLGVRAGIRAEIAFGILITDIASVGAIAQFGAYLKLYGYFIYTFEKLRPANTEAFNDTEEMLGALYVDFGLFVTVKFKAQVFLNLIKYEPTLYDGEFPLLTAGDKENVYDFALQEDGNDPLYIKDRDQNSSNGITMELPQIYRTMKQINLTSGDMSEAPYDLNRFNITFDDKRFTMDDAGVITVDVPEGERVLRTTMRVTWRGGKLAFSKYDIDIVVPVIWTNYTEAEQNEKFTASIAIGNETDGYTTVWSERYSRFDTFNLPTEDEVKELIGYDRYTLEDGTNVKYESIGGYSEPTENITLTSDKIFYFNTTLKNYTVTINNVQKEDGSVETRTYSTKYGGTFNFNDLSSTGTRNHITTTYTRFLRLADPKDTEADVPLTMTADLFFAETYGTIGASFNAEYLDTTFTATYTFIGLGNAVPDVEVKFEAGTTPSFDGLMDHIRQYGGENATILSISPVQGPSDSSITYTVTCAADETKTSHTVSFDTGGGTTIHEQRYPEGSLLIRPKDPSKTAHTFTGWFSDPSLTTPVDFSTYKMPANDITLYAGWQAETYTVHFVTTTGTAPSDRTIQYGNTYGELPVLSDENMTFLGWYTTETGGSEVKADTVFTGTADVTLYARWQMKQEITASDITGTNGNTETVTYDGNAHAFPLAINKDGVSADSFTIQYKTDTGSDEWTDTIPVDSGSYLVRVSRPADDTYKAVNNLVLNNNGASLIINKAEYTPARPKISVDNWQVTVEIPEEYADLLDDATLEYKLYILNQDYTEELKETRTLTKQDLATTKTITFTPTAAKAYDTYYITVTVGERRNYLPTGEGRNRGSFVFNEDGGAQTIMTGRSTGLASALLKAPSTLIRNHDATIQPGEASMTLTPDEVVLNRGKTFDVTLSLSAEMDIWGILAGIHYDSEVLTLENYTLGDMFEETQYLVQEDIAKIPFRILATRDTLSTEKASGTFVTLHFKVRDDAEEKDTSICFERLEVIGDRTVLNVKKDSDIPVAADDTAPSFDGIEEQGTYSGETEVTVIEDHLSSITVNGNAITPQNNTFTLSPMEGVQTIVATDKAGNSTTVSVTVIPAPDKEEEPTKPDRDDHETNSDNNGPGTGVNMYLNLWMTLLLLTGGMAIFFYHRQKQN